MLNDVRFYHLQRQSLEEALPRLLERVLERGLRICVKVPNHELLARLDECLWCYERTSFLPHGTEKDGQADRQPVYLTTDNACPNKAEVLVLINGAAMPPDLTSFSMCLYMFDGLDNDVVARARQDWLIFKEKASSLTYWQQKLEGGWEKKL